MASSHPVGLALFFMLLIAPGSGEGSGLAEDFENHVVQRHVVQSRFESGSDNMEFLEANIPFLQGCPPTSISC